MIYDEIFKLWEEKNIKIPVFVRVDDFVSAKQKNYIRFFEYCCKQGIFLDVATIPYPFIKFSKATYKIVSQLSSHVRFHQHGYKHKNNSRSDKLNEFPNTIPEAKIKSSIRMGNQILKEHLGPQYFNYYTPPFNLVNGRLVRVLKSLEFQLLSANGKYINHSNQFYPMQYLGINIDPILTYRPVKYKTFEAIMKEIVVRSERSPYIGILLHPNHMKERETELVKRVLTCLRKWKTFIFGDLKSLMNPSRGEEHV